MIDELNHALEDYQAKWQKLVSQRTTTAFFKALKPVAVGWKTKDQAEYKKLYAELHEHCDRIVETWMNDRWIAKMHLRDQKLTTGITIIKLMQRRPSSSDAVGLDHVDFYSPKVKNAEQILTKESNLKWTHESNDVVDNYAWISLWFDKTEAKLKANTVIDIVVDELNTMNAEITEPESQNLP